MILLQEEQTVQFSPMYVCYGHPPWYAEQFVLYLIATFVVMLVRCVQLAINLRNLCKVEKGRQPDGANWLLLWKVSSQRSKSLYRIAVLTFLLNLLVTTLLVINTLSSIRNQNAPVAPWVLGDLAEDLTPFAAGILICVLLYAAAFFFESRLERRKDAFSIAQGPTD